jgi:hypothetical protein
MPRSRRQSETELAKDVLSYFLRNPRAADNLEGVVRWRLPDERVHHVVETIDRALEWLVSQGYLKTSDTESAGRVFSLRTEKRVDAEQFVKTTADRGSLGKRVKRRSESRTRR